MCGGIAVVAASVGGMLVAEYAASYLLGSVLTVMPGQALGGTVATVALNAKKGVKWARTASKLMTNVRYMKKGVTIAKIVGGVSIGCFAENSNFVSKSNEESQIEVININAKRVKVGDVVMSLCKGKKIWTKVIENKEIGGSFEFVEFLFDNGAKLCVTIDHVMLINSTKIKAKDIKIGDIMCGENGEALMVKKRKQSFQNKKFDIKTEIGTIIANSVYVGALCS